MEDRLVIENALYAIVSLQQALFILSMFFNLKLQEVKW